MPCQRTAAWAVEVKALTGAMRDDDELADLLVVGEVLVVMQEQRTL